MKYEFLLESGLSMILHNPTVVPHSYDDMPIGMFKNPQVFAMRLKLVITDSEGLSSEIPYEWRSSTLPLSWDGEGLNAWADDRLAEHAIE